MMTPTQQQQLRQAWALSYALRTRPTKALAARYFEALKRLLNSSQNTGRAND